MQVRKEEIERYWQTAAERVFLYSRCLNLPAAQNLELALRALTKAEQKIMDRDTGDNPVTAAMEALLELLQKQQHEMIGDDNFFSYWCELKGRLVSGTEDISFSGALRRPVPPICRLHMTAQTLSSTGLRALIENLRRSKKYS